MEKLVFPKNEEKAQQMEKYMKNHFSFAGVPKPERANLQKIFLKKSRDLPVEKLLSLAEYYYDLPEREYQYVAIDLIQKNVDRLAFDDLVWLLSLVQKKQWWDSIDSWRSVYSTWCQLHKKQRLAVFQLFYQHEDFWLRRIAITLQLGFRKDVDTILLSQAIKYDQQTNEFFIQKAIGWALRDYSKTNALWVKEQLAVNTLSKLAIREASKYL